MSEPNQYYHVTCMKHILDLTALLELNQIKMKEGISACNILEMPVCMTSRFHSMIEDWFVNSGQSFDIEEYDQWDKAYDNCEQEFFVQEVNHQLSDCRKGEYTCEPIPEKLEKSVA